MLELLKLNRAMVEALVEAKMRKNKDCENVVSKCIEGIKPEIDKFMEWLDDDWLKNFINLFYLEAYNYAQYEFQSGTSYDSMRASCRRVCKEYDKISRKNL